jgi:hypothetical protein
LRINVLVKDHFINRKRNICKKKLIHNNMRHDQLGGDFTGMLLILILLMVVAGVGGLVAWKMKLFGLGGDDDSGDGGGGGDGGGDDGGGGDNNPENPSGSPITQSSEQCSSSFVDSGTPCILSNTQIETNLGPETLTALLKTPGDDGNCDDGYVKVDPTTFSYSSTDPQNAVCRKACRCLFAKEGVAPSDRCTDDVEYYKTKPETSSIEITTDIVDVVGDLYADWKTSTIFDKLTYSETNDVSPLAKTISCPFPANTDNKPKAAIEPRYTDGNVPGESNTDLQDFAGPGVILGEDWDKYSMKYSNLEEWNQSVDVAKYYPTQVYNCAYADNIARTDPSNNITDCEQIIQYKPIKVCKPRDYYETPKGFVGIPGVSATSTETGSLDGDEVAYAAGAYSKRGKVVSMYDSKCGGGYGTTSGNYYTTGFWEGIQTLASEPGVGNWNNCVVGQRYDGLYTGQSNSCNNFLHLQKGGGREVTWFAQKIDGTGYPMACVQASSVQGQLCGAPQPLDGNEEADVLETNAMSHSGCRTNNFSGPKTLKLDGIQDPSGSGVATCNPHIKYYNARGHANSEFPNF